MEYVVKYKNASKDKATQKTKQKDKEPDKDKEIENNYKIIKLNMTPSCDNI